jgi:hypothetical protein
MLVQVGSVRHPACAAVVGESDPSLYTGTIGATPGERGLHLKVYLDMSVYNRPFDDQTQPRIWLETLALGIILQMIEAGEIELVSSSVLRYEHSRNPFFPLRKQ